MTTLLDTPQQDPTRMRARALLRTESVLDTAGRRRTRISALRSQAPLKLRPAHGREPEPWPELADEGVRVCLTAAAAGPMGGDELELTIEVGQGSALVLTEASASLLLPGRERARSHLHVRVWVADGARFTWLPEPMIASQGCDHFNDVRIELAEDARLFVREQLLLGRRDEPSGRLHQSVRVSRGGRPVHTQDLVLGTDLGRTPAVVSGHRAIGSILVVDPDLPSTEPALLAGDGALLPLAAGNAVLAQALAPDTIVLRQQLDAALRLLGEPWGPRTRQPHPTEESP